MMLPHGPVKMTTQSDTQTCSERGSYLRQIPVGISVRTSSSVACPEEHSDLFSAPVHHTHQSLPL